MPGPSQRSLNLKLTIWRTSREAKQLITQIKLAIKEQAKREIINKINLEKHNNKEKGLNDTVNEDSGEIETLKI